MSSLIDSLLAAVADRPRDTVLRVHLAELLLAAGRQEEAITHAAQALAVDPADETARAIMTRAITPAAPTKEKKDEGGGIDWQAMEAELSDVIPPRFAVAGDEPEPVTGDGDGIVEVEASGVRLADVGGMREVKSRLEAAFLAPMRNPQLRAMYGKSLRGGLLLYGPPGCGKTFLARAVAGEMGAGFVVVSIVDVLDMWIGSSERNLHEIFETARRSAPCVLFLDEIDALGHKRSQLSSSAMRTTGNQLLAEMDGVDSANEGVFLLAATNAPWDVDPALRRPGRLDRMLFVAPPDAPARAAILEYHLRERPIANVDLGRLAAATEMFSGADLAHVCETAAEKAIQEVLASGEVRMIEQRDLEAAVREVRPSTGPWLTSARNVAQFGNQDGSYDELDRYLKRRRLG
ncbi:MAG TPA: AAA family ATPase [Rugosimonospora sp.]|nr:AAA family ATPase [Rugosimonospora sp.]